ncbi:hypothetical protein NA645_01640 [Pseudomonas stutzeri]|uniref:hypothetical protein n=1 Tax=Stutzerimonas stutzeri TaxID=316 RepID=UPI00210AD3B9|nr:hypothetical protein [Stutzerimonas stutzeri]MCQ4306685.1 hypothetical protein [Stutzerimonas stutzeri]
MRASHRECLHLRAYDATTGKELRKWRSPAGGHGSLGTKAGDSIIAYALPQ